MQAVGIRQGHRLSHCYFRPSAVNTQQVLPRLLGDLTVVGTWSAVEARQHNTQPVCFSSFPFSPPLKLTLLQLDVSSFHHADFAVVDGTRRLCRYAADIFMTPKSKTQEHYRVAVCLQTGTVVFALHKALPLSEPLHADAQDDRGSLLRLELFVQLRARQQANAFLTQHNARRQRSCTLHGPTLMKVSISIFLRLARASISTWQMAHM